MNPNDQSNILTTLQKIDEVLKNNTSGVILVPANPSEDALASATALYLAMLKLGKQVNIVCSKAVKSSLFGAEKIQTSLEPGGDSLVVSLPYVEGSIDKVDWNTSNGRFNIVVVPKDKNNKFEPKDVEFTYTGGKIDFIICIDTPNLNSLGDIYQKNQQKFSSAPIINIDRHLINNNYGMVNLVVKSSSSVSELVLQLIGVLKVELDKNISTNLYSGIHSATNALTSFSTNADTFLALALLLKNGAVKKIQNSFNNGFGAPSQVAPSMNPFQKNPFQVNPFSQNNPLQSFSQNANQAISNPFMSNPDLDDEEAYANDDALKPKIFKDSAGLV